MTFLVCSSNVIWIYPRHLCPRCNYVCTVCIELPARRPRAIGPRFPGCPKKGCFNPEICIYPLDSTLRSPICSTVCSSPDASRYYNSSYICIPISNMAGAVRQPIDIPSLERYIDQNVPALKTPLDVKQVCKHRVDVAAAIQMLIPF